MLRVARMPKSEDDPTQNVTVRLKRSTVRAVKVLAARKDSSISGLLTEQIENLVGKEQAYEMAKRQALALLDGGDFTWEG